MRMTNLDGKLKNYVASGVTPMHMPGHKRNPEFINPGFECDITEIDGFDNLHNAKGVIRDIEQDAAKLWGAKDAVISVNGATALILSVVCAASVRENSKLLIASNCHLSVWHALELTGVPFVTVNPTADKSAPFFLDITADAIKEKLDEDPQIRAIVLTSPTYEGIVSDTAAIYDIASEKGVLLIIDESHGAHFGLNEAFPGTAKADVVIKSCHKTLHTPTQTAILLGLTDKADMELIRHYMDIFETSSPSYVLMAGISRAINDLNSDPDLTQTWTCALMACRKRLGQELKHLRLFENEHAEPSKLVILTGGVTDGNELASRLRDNKIEIEAAFKTHIIAMTGIGDTEESLTKFADALIDIDKPLTGEVAGNFEFAIPTDETQMAMPISTAVTGAKETVPLSAAEGKISAGYIFNYPPGIPILIPGQKITKVRLECMPEGTRQVDIYKDFKV